MRLEVLELKNKYKHPGGRDPELFRICRYCHKISSAEWFGGPRVEMDLIKKCVVFVLLLHTAGAELERYPPITYLATLGSDSVIPCEYTIEKPPVDPRFFSAFWFYRGNKIASFENEVTTTDSGYSLDTEKALYGRVELSISNISVSDAGVYTCSVRYNPEWKMRDVTVDVQAPPQVAISNRTVNEKSVLLCSVTGFYPEHIAIKWFRGSERLSDVTEDRLLRNLDGTYSVNSTLTITPTEKDREQNVSCRVQHESLKQPLQEDFHLGYTDNSATSGNRNLMIIIPVVLGLLIIIVIVLIIYFKRKKQSTSKREFHSESNKDFVPVQACTQGLLLQTEIDHKPNTENTEGTRDISSDSSGEGAELKEISTEWRPENSEGGSPGDGDNKETLPLNNS